MKKRCIGATTFLIALWLVLFLPVYAFYTSYITQVGNFSCGSGAYVCFEITVNAFSSALFSLITIIGLVVLNSPRWLMYLLTSLYGMHYLYRCFEIAYEGRVLHGNTWSNTEVYFAFLHSDPVFYSAGVVGYILFTILLFSSHALLRKKTA